jgi:hypothetical protein
MGILGELPPDDMLAKLDEEIEAWKKADPETPIQPALHVIMVTAQGAPGRDKKYRLRMTDKVAEDVIAWAAKRDAIVFIDIQIGHSTLRKTLITLLLSWLTWLPSTICLLRCLLCIASPRK